MSSYYIAYGDEWKKEMNKLPKHTIIELFAKKAIEDLIKLQELEAENKSILKGNPNTN